MLKRLLTLGFVFTFLFGTALWAAQGSRRNTGTTSGTSSSGTATSGAANFVDHLARILNLTAEQKTAIQTLYDTLQTNVQPLRDQHKAQLEEIRTLLDETDPDPTTIGEKVIASHATIKQIEALFDNFATQVKALLTAEQLEKFETFLEMHDGHLPFGFGPGPGF
ncbi:MAG TPA: Spy/CpxP family protein refolding chaperone [Thermoanaerobaculia bacterium]|jgi:Spy/CpxP family protein refolding chaperone|nr:Spy/CpxP family protein refolding chaperone [Thermoanaerobaculia bacterium]